MGSTTKRLLFDLSVSRNFINKENIAPAHHSQKRNTTDNLWAMGVFDTVRMTTNQLAKHVLSGYAFSVAAVRENRRHRENFISSQLIGVDFDHGPNVATLAQDAMAKSYAFLIYATPSSTTEAPRSRALFLLDRPITDPEHRRILNMRLLHYYAQNDSKADASCKDCVRIFYGSKDAENRFDGGLVLPISVLEGLPPSPSELLEIDAKQRQEQAKQSKRTFAGDTASYERNYAVKALNNTADRLTTVAKGERHAELYKAGAAMGALSPLDDYEIFDALIDAVGGRGTDAERVLQDAIRQGRSNPYVIPAPIPRQQTTQRPTPPQTRAQTAATVASSEAVTDVRPYVTDDGLHYYRNPDYTAPADIADTAAAPSGKPLDVAQANPMPPPVAPAPRTKLVKLKDAVETYYTSAAVSFQPTDKVRGPIRLPFRTLHHLGGQIKNAISGQLYYVYGSTSQGKTTWARSLLRMMALQGIKSAIYSPEWTTEGYALVEMACKMPVHPDDKSKLAITRDQLIDHEYYLHKLRKAYGENTHSNYDQLKGKVDGWLDAWQFDALEKARRDVDRYAGNIEIFDRTATWEQIKTVWAEWLYETRAQGMQDGFLLIDSLDCLDTSQWGRNESLARQYGMLLEDAEQFCLLHSTNVMFIVQANKADGRFDPSNPKPLDMQSGSHINSNKAKCVITINPVFDGVDPHTGEPKRDDKKTHIYIAKNSGGALGGVVLESDRVRGLVKDVMIPTPNY